MHFGLASRDFLASKSIIPQKSAHIEVKLYLNLIGETYKHDAVKSKIHIEVKLYFSLIGEAYKYDKCFFQYYQQEECNQK